MAILEEKTQKSAEKNRDKQNILGRPATEVEGGVGGTLKYFLCLFRK